MTNQTHNALSMMSFGASCAVMLVSSQYALDSMGAAVATILSMWYCLIWLAVNSMGGRAMSIASRSVRALRLKSGKVYAELRVEVSGEYPPTAWTIEAIYSKHPYSMVDGVRYDLTEHEIQALRKAVNAV